MCFLHVRMCYHQERANEERVSISVEYRYERTAHNYEDFASGRVLYNAQGTTSFPVRLTSEIVQRCFALLQERGNNGPYTIYDPCCGGAAMLTTIGLMHGSSIRAIYASDADSRVLGIAENNLALLTAEGMERRRKQIEELYGAYGKSSHQDALGSIDRLEARLTGSRLERTTCFQADAVQADERRDQLLADGVDLIMTDLPYGSIVQWDGGANADASDLLQRLFDQAHARLKPGLSVLAVVADKSQKLRHERFERVQHFKIGKRHVGLFVPIPTEGGERI
jgi:23S rRNA (guanine2535-N1)-methyltransferase